jgi:hypothetical protein
VSLAATSRPGSIARPQVPRDWINLKEAALLLHCSMTTAWELCTRIDPLTGRPYLVSRRPSRFIDVSRSSVESHLAATQSDPQFWTKRRALAVPVQAVCKSRSARTKPPSELLSKTQTSTSAHRSR